MTPLAPLTMGAQGYQQGYQTAKDNGASDGDAEFAGVSQGGVMAAVGGAGTITKAMLPALKPILSRFPKLWSALTEEVSLSGAGPATKYSLERLAMDRPATKFVLNLAAGNAKTVSEFVAMGAANRGINEAVNPKGGDPLSAMADPAGIKSDIATGVAFHTVPAVVGAVGRRIFPASKPSVEPATTPAQPEASPAQVAPRTPEVIRSEMVKANRAGDLDKVDALKAEHDALTTPDPNIPHDETPTLPYNERIPAYPDTTGADRVAEISSSLDANRAQLERASSIAKRTKSKKAIKEEMRLRDLIDGQQAELEAVRAKVQAVPLPTEVQSVSEAPIPEPHTPEAAPAQPGEARAIPAEAPILDNGVTNDTTTQERVAGNDTGTEGGSSGTAQELGPKSHDESRQSKGRSLDESGILLNAAGKDHFVGAQESDIKHHETVTLPSGVKAEFNLGQGNEFSLDTGHGPHITGTVVDGDMHVGSHVGPEGIGKELHVEAAGLLSDLHLLPPTADSAGITTHAAIKSRSV